MSPKCMLKVMIAGMKPQEGSAAHIKPGRGTLENNCECVVMSYSCLYKDPLNVQGKKSLQKCSHCEAIR